MFDMTWNLYSQQKIDEKKYSQKYRPMIVEKRGGTSILATSCLSLVNSSPALG